MENLEEGILTLIKVKSELGSSELANALDGILRKLISYEGSGNTDFLISAQKLVQNLGRQHPFIKSLSLRDLFAVISREALELSAIANAVESIKIV